MWPLRFLAIFSLPSPDYIIKIKSKCEPTNKKKHTHITLLKWQINDKDFIEVQSE